MSGIWALTLKNLLLPQFCKQCGVRLLTEENHHFCPTCWERSPRIQRPFCSVCGRPHPQGVGLMTDRLFPCAECASATEKPPFRKVIAAAYYTGPVEEAVKLLKFHGKQNLVRAISALMVRAAEQELDVAAYDFLLPVPLHRVRERARGFNQSRLLAEAVLPTFPGAALDEALRRIRPTRTQSLLKRKDRKANLRGAFAVVDGGHLRGKTVLLVDDVATSYGTVSECAAAVRRAGAAAVDVLVAALAVYTGEME